ncbi:hypothetical protein AV530_000472 [Patagioenas fasciata monilis]|uniref:Uncharacterized protein n=1 Tax=Patagioenas fasciata monilis TaxID=372326 RepID=A0A1V4K3F5_PATFA|nr:hypothetical protein AV530_000472 [Patagioenas fasciata monilis]
MRFTARPPWIGQVRREKGLIFTIVFPPSPNTLSIIVLQVAETHECSDEIDQPHPCQTLRLLQTLLQETLIFSKNATCCSSDTEKRALQVSVTNPVQCSLHGRKCTVSVETKINQSQPDFTKHRSGFVLCVPGN